MANVTLDLSQFGIEGVGNVTLQNIQETVEGKGIDQFPRNDQERAYVKQVLEQVQTYKKAQTNVPESLRDALADYEKRIQMEQARIQDPIGTYLAGVKKEAQTGPGLMEGLSEFKNILPGGQPFDLDKSLEGIINFGQRVLIGDNPKAQFGDIAVIGSDVAAIKLLAKNNSLASQRMDSALISNAVKNNPAYAAGALTGMNVFARGTANETYDMLNQLTRYLYDIPNPEEAIRKNQQLRDIYDMRNELLWSGGAVGLSNLFPYIKNAWGKKLLGVTEDSKALMKKAEQANVPMNVFSVTESGIVKGSGKVIGLFPFVATKAREVQNAQQVAIANHINKTLNNFSPIGLLNDAGLLADKAFREGIQNFENTKTILYDQAMDIATTGLKGEKFIPTALIKEEAAKLAARFNRDTSKVMVDFDVKNRGYSESVSFQDLVSNISSSMKEKRQLYDVLPALANMKDDYISGEQFISLQTALNDLLREGERLQMGSNVASYIKPFTNAMITSLDDFNNYKVLEDVPKDKLKKEFAAALDLANNFFFENKDTLKGRTGQVLSLVDRNITKAGAEAAPGFITADMVAEMLLDSKAMNAPMAIREMKKALGTTKVMIDGKEQTVDVFNTIAKSVLDNKIRKATRYISGSVPAAPGEGLIGGVEKRSIGQMISGAEAATDWGKTKKNFNIPILDVERMQEIFGMGVNGNPNAMAGMKEILGEKTFQKLEDVLELAGTVQQTSFGDVSDFVKRRGFLGGANAVTNLITGGMIASNPFGNVGLMLMARYGMSTLADPKFLEGVATLLNPTVETLAKRNALMTLGRMRWDDIRGEDQVNQLPAELLEDFDPGNPMDVMQYLLFTDNQSAFPGSERLRIESNDDGMTTGVEITKAHSEPIFSEDGQKAGEALSEQEVVMSDAAPKVAQDPFLNVDFESMQETIPAAGASAPLSEEQRIALAGGDLDEAIAMGSRRL